MNKILYQADQAKSIEIKTCANTVHTSRAHFHDEVSIGIIEQGSCRTEIGHHSFHLSEGTLLIIPSKAVHRCQPKDTTNWRFKMIYLGDSLFSKIFGDMVRNGSIYPKLKSGTFQYVIKTFKLFEESLLNQETEPKVLIDLMNVMDLHEKGSIKQNSEPPNSEKIGNIIQYLNKHYLSRITIDELSEQFGINKYQLIRQFHSCTGLTPQKYLINLRINEAKKMLQNNRPIADVAIASGFYDQSHFDKYFKAYTGVVPMNYCLHQP
ncbi:AraC family transcriptional regulator [Sporolactobacillus laevolacticus]|uniref:AraC family transcriptional regulator n=1 Tax=Sporolactobacillus laevolacticus TaxID=33018 RepID=UPI0025B33EFE|nr:AraC family transcriptional regulator [Sporolactobacillus laevolacticus]MDN3956345.1 AraC family transcriptional regulator [Sporolactobacillus laevolacticus]